MAGIEQMYPGNFGIDTWDKGDSQSIYSHRRMEVKSEVTICIWPEKYPGHRLASPSRENQVRILITVRLRPRIVLTNRSE